MDATSQVIQTTPKAGAILGPETAPVEIYLLTAIDGARCFGDNCPLMPLPEFCRTTTRIPEDS